MLKFGPYSYLNSGRKMIGLYCVTYDSTCTTDTDCNPGHKIPRVESALLSQHNLEQCKDLQLSNASRSLIDV